MKKIIMTLVACAAIAACSPNEVTVETWLPVEIALYVTDTEGLISDGDELAVVAECTREGERTAMSENVVARYIASVTSSGLSLSPATEKDKLMAEYGDSDVDITVASPYSENISLDPEVPTVQKYGQKLPSLIYGQASMERVAEGIDIVVKDMPLCSVLELEIPSDLVAEKTLVLSDLTVQNVKVEFDGGLTLSEKRTVKVAMNPFAVPYGGIDILFRTTDGEDYSSKVLSGSSDAGHRISLGESLLAYVPSADPFRPCTFPVVFPLGPDDSRLGYHCNHDEQPDWNNRGIWRCAGQKQAYAVWTQVSKPDPTKEQKREIVGGANVAAGDIGSVGLKGIWTGDYFEFVLPVKDVEAGSVVSFEAPFYGREHPVFWTVEWLDGGVWTKNTTTVKAWDGTEAEASFALRLHGTVVNYRFRLDHAIERGELRVRLVCADGGLQADNSTNKVVRRELPYYSRSGYQAPFYFYCQDSGVTAFTWNISQGADEPESAGTEELTVRNTDWTWE